MATASSKGKRTNGGKSVNRSTMVNENEGTTVFINARLIDPASNRDEAGGLAFRDGIITDIGPHLRRNAPDASHVIDCRGCVLAPGLIDAQVFVGEPGA